MQHGIIIANTGEAIINALNIIIENNVATKSDFIFLSSDECQATEKIKDLGFNYYIYPYRNANDFSIFANKYFSTCTDILLSFARLISEDLFLHIPTFNVHPTLLPAFRGLNPLQKMYNYLPKFIGSTIHLIDKEIDHGQILCQTINAVKHDISWEEYSEISFFQRTYLVILFYELMESSAIEISKDMTSFIWKKKYSYSNFANPCLNNASLESSFIEFKNKVKKY